MCAQAVVFASEKGTTKAFAETIAHRTGFPLIDAKEFDVTTVGSYSLIIFVVCSYGKGVAPPSSKDKFEALYGQALGALKFAVFCNGSSKFPAFLGFGKTLVAKLTELGATQVGGLGQNDRNGSVSNLDEWLPTLGVPLV
jgi:flavodoxin